MMFEIILALTALLAVFVSTRTFYLKKIANIEKSHKDAIDAEFLIGHKAGWDGGFQYGKHRGRMDLLEEQRTKK